MRNHSLIVALAFLMAAAGSGTGLAQPWASADRVAIRTQQLTEQSRRFHRELRHQPGYSGLARQTASFIRSTEELDREVRRSRSYRNIIDEYEDVEEDFQELRQFVFRAYRARPDDRLTNSWIRLVAAHERLALELRAGAYGPQWPRHRRYQDQVPGPYYDHDYDDDVWDRD